MKLVPAEGPWLEEVLDTTFTIWHEGLDRAAYGRYWAAQCRTAWGGAHLHRFALVARGEAVASAKQYDFRAQLDGTPIRVAGIGAVFTPAAHRGRGHARVLIEELLSRAAADGFDVALLFSEIGPEYYARLGFDVVATFESTLRVHAPGSGGAPAMLVRAGDDRDLAAIAAINEVRAAPYRFRLDRDRDLVQYAIAKKRLLAGLAPPGDRGVQFFVVEEGATAVAYVVISTHAGEWTIEECGDRDPSGARVGAMLQTLLARDPGARAPTIRAWLPAGFLPPQITIKSRRPSAQVMMIRPLGDRARPSPPLGADEVLWWHGDLF